jgi:hypothetical protein
VNLSGADLSGADLSGADLSGADLCGADLRGADLCGVNLSSANLRGVSLSGANLIDADLRGAKFDFIEKIEHAKAEIPALYIALMDGKVDGSAYEGECACFVGTIANARKCHYKELVNIKSNGDSPIESLFLAIRKGDTPENNPISKIVVGWIEEFCKEQGIKLPTRKVIWE